MKLIIRIILIGGLTYVFSLFMGIWWMCMIASFLMCSILPTNALNSFISGFLGAGLIWLSSAWSLDVENASAFSSKIATIMKLGEPIYLVLVSGAVGGLSSGLSGITGSYFRKIFKKETKKSFYS